MEKRLQGFAGKIPIVGGELKGLGWAGPDCQRSYRGCCYGRCRDGQRKTLDLGRELGKTREITGASAEGIQILGRAFEETNGSAGAVESTATPRQPLHRRGRDGNKAYQESFDLIGLSYEDLAKLSPEDALHGRYRRDQRSAGAGRGRQHSKLKSWGVATSEWAALPIWHHGRD